MEMIFGYSTNAFVEVSLLEAIEQIAGLGFKGVELMGDRPHLYPPDVDKEGLEQIKAALARHHLKPTNINSFTLFAVGDTYLPSWIEPEPARRRIRIDHTLSCLDVAAALGCGCISVPPGGPLNGMARKEAMALFYQGLEQVVPRAEALGVQILVEPEPHLMLERTEEFLGFIKDIRSPRVGINFDIGHFFCAGEDPARSFETLFEWIGHVHLEDIGRDRVHQHLIPGLGAIDFDAVFDTMADLGYRGDISLELYPYTDRPLAAGQESLAHLRPVFRRSRLGLEV